MKSIGARPIRVARRSFGTLLANRQREKCPVCHTQIAVVGICESCNWRRRLTAVEWIDLLIDPGSSLPLSGGQATLAEDSVLAASAQISRQPAIFIVFDFAAAGGSLGVAAGERIVLACREAIAAQWPIVMVVASSGARIQEGLRALFQMPRTAAAVMSLQEARLPLIVLLTDPSTGAPYASCANLADVVLAEPGALIGFAGPRVVTAVTGEPTDGRRAEDLLPRGIIDAVIHRSDLREAISMLLMLLRPSRPSLPRSRVSLPLPKPRGERWTMVEMVRSPRWPTGVRWLELLSERRFSLRGDRTGDDDPALNCAFVEIEGFHVLALAHNRRAGSGAVTAAGYRKAIRALEIADRLGLPVLTLIDTPGAAVGPEADDSGIGYWIARCLQTFLAIRVPIIALVVGEGASGGALALSVGDRIYMVDNSIFAVTPPEAAAAIFYRECDTIQAWADRLQLAAADALKLGLIDGVVPGTALDRRSRAIQVRRIRKLLRATFTDLSALSPADLVKTRRDRYLATPEAPILLEDG